MCSVLLRAPAGPSVSECVHTVAPLLLLLLLCATAPAKQKHAVPKHFQLDSFLRGHACSKPRARRPGPARHGLRAEPVSAGRPTVAEPRIPRERRLLFLGLPFFLSVFLCAVVVPRMR